MRRSESRVIPAETLEALFVALRSEGYTVIGPTRRDGAIVYDELSGTADLPRGWTDEQGGGRYRLRRREDDAWFGFAVGPHSWKRNLQVPRRRLWRARRSEDGFDLEDGAESPPRLALVGVRACELHAIAIQDRVLLHGSVSDPDYAARRENVFLIAVNCSDPAATCFCASMGTGPKVEGSYDLALTELLEGSRHDFLVDVGSEAGARIIDKIATAPAGEADLEAAEVVSREAARRMGRTLETEGIRDLLYRNLEHPRWDDVARRCLGCANCTMVCPTCFCTAVEDVTDLDGQTAERIQVWDSCFTAQHSWIHGGSVRPDIRSRYRQWLTHKLASWIDQFGTSGCVGCGRCITWCPVGIDLTEEVAAIRGGTQETGP